METLISVSEFDPSTLAQIMLFILKAFPLAAELLRAAAKDAVTAYLAVLPVIVVGLFKFGLPFCYLYSFI